MVSCSNLVWKKEKKLEECIEAIFKKKCFEIFQMPEAKGPYKEVLSFRIECKNVRYHYQVQGFKAEARWKT